MIIDATDTVLGRMAARAAKELMKGQEVIIVNADNAVVSGTPRRVLESYREKRKIGSALHGPYFPRYPDRIIWRTIRGMMPYKKPRGRAAMKKLKVYRGHPEEFKDAVKITKTSNKLKCRHVTIKEISKFLGAKI